jgi:hypothetical protein
VTAPEPATTAERVAELERQLTQLRADFNTSTFCLEAAFAAGAEYGRTGGVGRQPARPAGAPPARRSRTRTRTGGRTVTTPDRQAEASDLGRFEPTAYDVGITDDPGPESPTRAGLWAAQNAPRIGDAAGCTGAEYERLLDIRYQAETAYLARHGSLAPEPRTEAELAAEARGPHSPVPYSLTPQGEAALGDAAEEAELDAEAEADWAHEWDSADSAAYIDRVEAGLEPEAEL